MQYYSHSARVNPFPFCNHAFQIENRAELIDRTRKTQQTAGAILFIYEITPQQPFIVSETLASPCPTF